MVQDNDSSLDNSCREGVSSEDVRAAIKLLETLIELGLFAVYGDEDNPDETAIIDCEERKGCCGAICCSLVFALRKEEIQKGIIQWDTKRPYFIARDDDGYCPHLDRVSLKCTQWEERPLRCRKYDCRKESNVWIDWERKIINQDVFKHLPKSRSS